MGNDYSISEEFIYTTKGEIANNIDNMNRFKYENMRMYKDFLKIQIMSLAKRYGFTSIKNYLVENELEETVNIDVVWIGKGRMAISSFIITDYYNEKVLQSLSIYDAPYKFWIYLGNKEIINIEQIIKINNIHYIPIPVISSDLLCLG